MMSWWNREVHIWRLTKLSKAQPETEDSDEEPTTQNRKLVAKILIKGEANITSASLNADGSLLAVSTASDIKVFQLKPRKAEEGDGLRISKVNVPSSFSSGARLIQFSPDGKWLSIVRPDSNVTVARITPGSSSTSSTIYPRLSKLSRIDRRIEKFVLLGGLGSYERTITQTAFSSDSRVIAVSDLAGYIDTFVLAGDEDLTLEETNSDSDAASSSDSSISDSDSDDEEEAKPKLIFGQHWTRNPLASSLPQLPSTPLILSFRPSASTHNSLPSTKIASPHPTRNNPHPVPHQLPAGEDRLLAMTATSGIFEFEVLKGGLSAWSRRNPTSVFPEEFRNTLDLARGCVWDISESKERVWIWGVSWLWMFDLSRDLPAPGSEEVNGEEKESKTVGKKRKRKAAGGAIPDSKLGTGISRKMQKVVHEEVDESHALVNEASDDDEEDESSTALERLRRENSSKSDGDGKAAFWHTSKYRPILGMVLIGEEGEAGPEVALVERPIWEADLPPRYYGDQEWEKSGVEL